MVEYVILKESKNPFIINDYYYIKNQGDKNKTNNYIDELENHTKKEIIIERQKHICDDMKLVNTSKNLIETFNKRNSLDNIIDKKNENNVMMQSYVDENSIYLINIFEEKNRRQLKNSRSDENINIYGKYNNNNPKEYKFKQKSLVLSNSYSNILKY